MTVIELAKAVGMPYDPNGWATLQAGPHRLAWNGTHLTAFDHAGRRAGLTQVAHTVACWCCAQPHLRGRPYFGLDWNEQHAAAAVTLVIFAAVGVIAPAAVVDDQADPAALARAIALLAEAGFEIKQVCALRVEHKIRVSPT